MKIMEYDDKQLKGDMDEVKSDLRTLRSRPSFIVPSREGLYIMAFIGMIVGVKSCNRTHDLLERTKPLEIITRNVIGNSEPEKFYVVDGNRAYLEIDGRPVDTYAPQKLPEGGIR